jgi:hypothetical protein
LFAIAAIDGAEPLSELANPPAEALTNGEKIHKMGSLDWPVGQAL